MSSNDFFTAVPRTTTLFHVRSWSPVTFVTSIGVTFLTGFGVTQYYKFNKQVILISVKPMSEHRIRVATEADFDGVMAFGDMFLGIDYLRYRYHSFLADPNATSYAYTIGEDIVGYCCVVLVDDGMTLLIRGSRVKSGHQGQGIYGRLTKHVYKEHKKIPTLKYEAFTTNNLNYDANKHGLHRSYSLISRKAFPNYRFKAEDITIPVSPSIADIQEVTSDDLILLFAADELHDALFPGGKLLIDWVPLRLLPSNIKYIVKESEYENSKALQSKNDNSQVSLLTVATSIPCELGLKFIIDVFGNDVIMLREHILSHLGYVKKLTSDMVVLQITVEPNLETNANDIVRALGISVFGIEINTVFNFERPFR